ncbi:hypothetical protein BD410DRAFT_780924, partial [Rickenella mellea]
MQTVATAGITAAPERNRDAEHLSLVELMLHYYMVIKCEERRWTILLGVKNVPRM